MSQLASTAALTYDAGTMKCLLEKELQKIPHYLTKKNQAFQQMIGEALSTGAIPRTNKNREDLRKLALVMYRQSFIGIVSNLWTTYLKSGLGKLFDQSNEHPAYPSNLRIWPKDLKQIIQQFVRLNQSNENETRRSFVTGYLSMLDDQLKQYHSELNKQKLRLPSCTLAVQEIMETYIKENLSPIRMDIEHQIELINYDYHIRALKVQYYQQSSNEDQVYFPC